MDQKNKEQNVADLTRELSETRHFNERIIEALPGGMVHVAPDGSIQNANSEALRILGLSYDALTRRYTSDFKTETIKEDGSPCPVEEYPVSRALATGQAQPPMTIGTRRPDGKIAWAIFTAVPLSDEQGATTGAVVTFLDITHRKRDEEKLRYSRERYRRLVQSAPVGIVVHTRGRFIFLNEAAADLLGGQIEDLIDRKVEDFVHPDYRAKVAERIRLLTEHEVDSTPGMEEKLIRVDGRSIEVEVHGIRLYEEEPMVMAIMLDISERKKNEDYIRFLAYHDSLTSLGNRALLTETLEKEIDRLQNAPGSLAVLFLDLDRLKLINDTLGHSAGDWVIRQVARRIQSVTPERATLCRQGGDEFIIVLPDPDGEESTTLANVILQVLQQPIEFRGDEYFVSASVGIARYPENGTDGETLLKNADAALYRAKDRGGNTFSLASRLPRQKSETDLSLNTRMHRALEHGDFLLYYQPILDRAGKLHKWEALIRWPQSDGSFLPPDRFIPLAEETGLIRFIDEWVLEQASREVQSFPGEPASISVNLSPREFESKEFPDKLFRILDRTGLAPDRLVLESTERTLIDDLDKTGKILATLHDGGVRISLDDFGVGYTSLGYLKRLPIASLKMDRSLLMGAPDDPDATLIVSAIVGLGRNLGIEVIAEGVETESQLEYLREIQCDAMQGFFLGKPMPPDQVPDFIERL